MKWKIWQSCSVCGCRKTTDNETLNELSAYCDLCKHKIDIYFMSYAIDIAMRGGLSYIIKELNFTQKFAKIVPELPKLEKEHIVVEKKSRYRCSIEKFCLKEMQSWFLKVRSEKKRKNLHSIGQD